MDACGVGVRRPVVEASSSSFDFAFREPELRSGQGSEGIRTATSFRSFVSWCRRQGEAMMFDRRAGQAYCNARSTRRGKKKKKKRQKEGRGWPRPGK
jgi:hypothetical protein